MLDEPQELQTLSYRWIMWSLAGLLAILCLVLGGYAAYTMPTDPAEHLHSQPYEHYLYVPRAYTADRDWPVFVGFHGSGGTGRDCWDWWQTYVNRESFILICPTFSDENGGWYQDEGEWKLNAILYQVGSEYRLEPRIFLAGFSAGGQFVQGYAFHNPQAVNGVAVLSPGNYYLPGAGARGVPFLVVIGDRDIARRLDAAQEFVSILEQDNFNVEYHLLPAVGHTVSNKARQLTIDLFRAVNGKD